MVGDCWVYVLDDCFADCVVLAWCVFDVLVSWLVGWLVGRFVGWLVGLLLDWFVVWLVDGLFGLLGDGF